MPFYNNLDTVDAALKSVKKCGYGNCEVIVINDGSEQDPSGIVKKYKKARLVYKENGGLGSARNRGIEEAKGKYLLFLDSDDTLYFGGLNALVDLAEKNGLQVAAGRTRRVEADSGKFKYWRKEIYSENYINEMSQRHLMFADTLSTAKIYRADLFKDGDHRFDKGLFEDIPFIADIYSTVDRIGITKNTVQNWMIYGLGTSITTRLTIENVRERIRRLDQVFEKRSEEHRKYYAAQFINNQIVYCVNGFRKQSADERHEIYDKLRHSMLMREKYIDKELITKSDNMMLADAILRDDYDEFETYALAFSDKYYDIRG